MSDMENSDSDSSIQTVCSQTENLNKADQQDRQATKIQPAKQPNFRKVLKSQQLQPRRKGPRIKIRESPRIRRREKIHA